MNKREELVNILNNSFNTFFTVEENVYKIEFYSNLDYELKEKHFDALEQIRKNTKFRYRYQLEPFKIWLVINIQDFENIDPNLITSILQICKFNL